MIKLSVVQSRANYDILRSKNIDQFREISQHEFDKTYDINARDAAGNIPRAAP